MACTQGCKTKDHESYAACLRSQMLRVTSTRGDQRKDDKELDLYREARAAGLQPKTTRTVDSQSALGANG